MTTDEPIASRSAGRAMQGLHAHTHANAYTCARALVLAATVAIAGAPLACNDVPEDPAQSTAPEMTNEVEDPTAVARERLVRRTIEARGVEDPRVLAAMRAVPRHLFVPEGWRADAYADAALPLSHDQTISQPYIVALMTEALALDFDGPRPPKVLEVGTGSGYQAAVLAEMGAEVYSIEIVAPLAESAAALLDELGYENVHVRAGDGYRGWPEEAPFDAVIVTAAPPEVPEPLKQQLREGGRLVIPVGDEDQDLYRYTRRGERFDHEHLSAVRFVPMTGEAQGD